jgi:hypothetical protein
MRVGRPIAVFALTLFFLFSLAKTTIAAATPSLSTSTSSSSSSSSSTSPAIETAKQGWVRVGVVVASRSGLKDDKPLQYAYSDGERLQKVLRSLGQMAAEHLHFIRTESAVDLLHQAEVVGRQIATLRQGGSKVLLQFYYTGHGGGRSFHLGGEQVGFGEVKALLEKGNPEARIYVLDVCQGASFFASKGFTTTQPVRVAIELDKATKGEVTISSSASEEQAYEVKTLGGSIFTSHWEMALRGAGDRNRDGQVTLFEAYNYAYDQTVAFSRENLNLPQHPSFSIDLTGAKDLQLTRPGNDQGGLLFRECPVGTYALLDTKRGIPVGEMRIPEVGDYSLALEPGVYRIDHMPSRGFALTAQAEVAQASLTALRAEHFIRKARKSALGKGSAQPYGFTAEDEPGLTPGSASHFAPSLAPSLAQWDFVVFGSLRSPDQGFAREAFMAASPSGFDMREQFDLRGGFARPELGMTWGLQTLKRGREGVLQGFMGGFQVLAESFTYHYAAEGREPTFGGASGSGLGASTGAQAGSGPKVAVTRRMQVTPLIFGLVGVKHFFGPSFGLTVDASAGVMRQSVHLDNRIASESHGVFESEQDLSGWGYAFDGHIVPSYAMRLPGASEWVRFGLRLGAGYRMIEEVSDQHGNSIGLSPTWAWRAGLQIGLSGGRLW